MSTFFGFVGDEVIDQISWRSAADMQGEVEKRLHLLNLLLLWYEGSVVVR